MDLIHQTLLTKMKKGILLQALGHKNYYHMAVVLAVSIKANEPDMPICLITDNKVQDKHIALFDIIKSFNGVAGEYIRAKLLMYDYSPFDETIFLDVDQVLISNRKLSNVFEELKDVDFSISNTGVAQKSVWCDIAEVNKLFGKGPFWNFHSEFVYFKKKEVVQDYFDTAKMVFDEAEIKSAVVFSNSRMADELAFQCASIITGLYPHKENWLPNFWHSAHPKLAYKYPYQLDSFITYSIGGNSTPQHVKTCYNTLAKAYFAKLGLLDPFQVVDKRTYLPERSLI